MNHRTALPNIGSKNVTSIYPLRRTNFVIMRTQKRNYIGQVLDIYRRGSGSRHGSILESATISGLSYLSLRVFLVLDVVSSSLWIVAKLNKY